MDINFVYDYLAKKEKALTAENEEALKERLYQIKKNSIDNLPGLKEKAIKNLKENGFFVYEAKTNEEARKILIRVIGSAKNLVKSKSNTIDELDLKKLAKEKKWNLTETDIGDFLADLMGKESGHPVLPALTLNISEIAQKIKTSSSPQEMVNYLSSIIRKKILESEIGLTGANAITSSGQAVILENEGNISLVSRIPKIHIIVAGIEKIVPTLEDSLHVCRCAAIWGTGQTLTSYISIISGPSKTADIQNQIVVGAQGAKEVHLILLDDWRSGFLSSPYKEMLYCINCGACLDICPVFITEEKVIKILEPEKNFNCAICGECTQVCPAKIDWLSLTRLARKMHAKNKKVPAAVTEMLENVKKFANPFGKITGKKIPKKLYCC